MKNLTSEFVRNILDYNPDIGVFMWKIRPLNYFAREADSKTWNVKYAGKMAGSVNKDGYRAICINNKIYYEHRLAWLIVKGEWPQHEIDHRDTIKSNNKWNNLREATGSQNRSNTKIRRDSLTGIKGVYFDKKRNKWSAQITFQRKHINLGRFNSPEAAFAAYCKAAEQYQGEFARVG